MFLFLMICLAVVAIAIVAWLYLLLSRKALDGSLRPGNEQAGKPLVRMPGTGRSSASTTGEYPLPGGGGATAAAGSAPTTSSAMPAGTVSAGAAPAAVPEPAVIRTTTTGDAPKAKSANASAAGKPAKGKSKKAKAAGASAATTGKPGKSTKAKAGKDATGAAATGAKAEPTASVAAASAGSPPKMPAPEGPLFTAPTGAKNKLTDIKGIGPVAERQLNEQGITTFAQIAGLSAADIQRIDDYMPFSDRQIRDWQKQAKSRA